MGEPIQEFSLAKKCNHALKYLRKLLSSKDTADWRSL